MSACDCCTTPPNIFVKLQFSSFDRSCENSCILSSPEICSGNSDWLRGPFLTALSASGEKTETVDRSRPEDEYVYIASQYRKTSAFLELFDTHVGFSGPYDCPCEHGYSEEQNSSETETITFEDCSTTTTTECSGDQILTSEADGERCSFGCPPYIAPDFIVIFGGGVAGSYTTTVTTTCQNGEAPDPITVTFGQDCTAIEGCPKPALMENLVLTSNITNYGKSAACLFERNEILFPPFKEPFSSNEAIVSPINELNIEELPNYQGHETESYRFVRGQGGRWRSQSEQHIKFRVVHHPSPTCYLKIWFAKKITITKRGTGCPNDPFFQPEEVYWEDLDYVYVWKPTSNIECIKSESGMYQTKSLIIGPEKILEIPSPKVDDREFGITEEIFIKKISLIDGFEPPDPPSTLPQGFGVQSMEIGSLNCLQSGESPISDGGTCSEAWACPYHFIDELIECSEQNIQ
jgi:hypothetical protein